MHELTGRQPKRILIVEDDQSTAHWLIMAFEMELKGAPDGTNQGRCMFGQWVVTVASTASTAASILHDNEFDVVLLDLILPDAEKDDLIRIIKEAAPHIPIVAHSGLSEVGMVARLLSAGDVVDYIVKGDKTNPHALKQTICHAIDRFHTVREITQHQARWQAQNGTALSSSLAAIN
jgi:PleD family two-component response regulator